MALQEAQVGRGESEQEVRLDALEEMDYLACLVRLEKEDPMDCQESMDCRVTRETVAFQDLQAHQAPLVCLGVLALGDPVETQVHLVPLATEALRGRGAREQRTESLVSQAH